MVGSRPCFAGVAHRLAKQFYQESKGNRKIKKGV